MNKFEKLASQTPLRARALYLNGKRIKKILAWLFLWPIILFLLLENKIREVFYNSIEFTQKRAKKFLDKYLPRYLRKHGSMRITPTLGFFVCRAGLNLPEYPNLKTGWGFIKNPFWKNFRMKYYRQIEDYAFEYYTISGFKKYHPSDEDYMIVTGYTGKSLGGLAIYFKRKP